MNKIPYDPLRRRGWYDNNRQMELKRANDWYTRNKERASAQRKKRATELREEMFTTLGDYCKCCRETIKRFLTLDHIQNDGYKEEKGRKRSGQPMLLKAKHEGWKRDRFQVLCFNCNIGKSLNGGICPHQRISTVNV